MLPEFGLFALILAFCLAMVQASVPLLGSLRGNIAWQNMARPLALGQCCFVLAAFAILAYSFVVNDFSVVYVAENSNTHLPWFYRICAVWGAHEGSVLLWVTILSLWTAAVALFSRQMPRDMVATVIAVLGMVSVGFLLFILATSNPFHRLLPDFPAEGRDLNPLLQDPGLVIHPPMLYTGYVGFSVAFAFAVAALISGRMDSAWVRWTRPWTLVAWTFLTFGITLGSWWAYRVLGWGGWWFWDPVENASFMPWLVGTALVHSLLVSEKRGAFKGWTLLLAITTFALSLIGTFLVRSGVLVSVHAFAVDPTRGAYLLKYIAVVIGVSLALYAWRAEKLRQFVHFDLLTRESFLLINNVILVVACFTVLLGTLYPLVMQALDMGKLSVGPPYFNLVFVPLMSVLFVVMGMGPLSYWRKSAWHKVVPKLRKALLISAALALLFMLAAVGGIHWGVLLGLELALWVAVTTVLSLRHKSLSRGGVSQLSGSDWGMGFAHIGIAVVIIGVTLTSSLAQQRDVALQPGAAADIGPYQIKYLDDNGIEGPNYHGAGVRFELSKHGNYVATILAEKRIYNASQMPMTQAAINANLWRDIYVALGNPLDKDGWTVRLYYKPFVRWIWLGGLLIMLGGICATADKRYRTKRVSIALTGEVADEAKPVFNEASL